MPNKYLHGNGYDCPACSLRRKAAASDFHMGHDPGADSIACNMCDGTGRVARSPQDIIRDAVNEALIHHWPQKTARQTLTCPESPTTKQRQV